MKCPTCGTIYNITNGRCFECGYPEICDWCKEQINKNEKNKTYRIKEWYWSFHGKPPYPFNDKLEVRELTSNKSLWFICKRCYDKYKNVRKKIG